MCVQKSPAIVALVLKSFYVWIFFILESMELRKFQNERSSFKYYYQYT